jgi:serine/threonine-protein kinase RsbW
MALKDDLNGMLGECTKRPILSLRKKVSKIRLPARIENLKELMGFVSGFAQKAGFTRKKIPKIELATEEALLNIFNYAYSGDHGGEVEVRCRMEDNFTLIIDILDTGIPFDIRAVPDPDTSSGISERKIGGLGIFLIRKMVDEVRYRQEGKSNILTFVIHKKK